MGRNSVCSSVCLSPPPQLALRLLQLALRPLQLALRPLQLALRPLQLGLRPLRLALRLLWLALSLFGWSSDPSGWASDSLLLGLGLLLQPEGCEACWVYIISPFCPNRHCLLSGLSTFI